MADPEAAQPAGRARARAVPTKKLARMVPGDPWLASTDEPQTMGELKRSFQRRIRADIAAGWHQRQLSTVGMRLRNLREQIMADGQLAIGRCAGCSAAADACERVLDTAEDALTSMLGAIGICSQWAAADEKYAERMVTENTLLVARFARAVRVESEAAASPSLARAHGQGRSQLETIGSGGGRLTVVQMSAELSHRKEDLTSRISATESAAADAEANAAQVDSRLTAATYEQMEAGMRQQNELESLRRLVSEQVAEVRQAQLATHARRDELLQIRYRCVGGWWG
jgi:hypothetical protein